LVVGNVQVDLATDAAVRTNRADDFVRMADLLGCEALPRHHLEDRARRTDANALPAPGAPRFVRVPVRTDDDLRVLAPEAHVQYADHLDVFARAHAARAEDAGRHVMADHRVAGALVARAQRQVPGIEGGGDDAVLHEVALEFVARLGAATVP